MICCMTSLACASRSSISEYASQIVSNTKFSVSVQNLMSFNFRIFHSSLEIIKFEYKRFSVKNKASLTF
jgi:hypothetical protein